MTTHSRARPDWTALLALLLFVAAPRAFATNDMRPLAVMVLTQMCAAQDAQFRDSPFLRMLSRRPDFRGWDEFDSRPLSRCLRERQWVPKSVCVSATQLDSTDRNKFDAWFNQNAQTLQALEPVFEFFDRASQGDTADEACPQITLRTDSAPSLPDITIKRVELVWAGEYEGVVSPVPNVTLTKRTDRIEAAVGVHFGIYFNIVAEPAEGILTVTYETVVPPPGVPIGPGGERRRELTDRPQCVLGQPCVVGWVFSRDEEIIPGKWQLKVSFRGQPLIEHEFTVERRQPAAAKRETLASR